MTTISTSNIPTVLLSAAQEIHTYKLMQAEAYTQLANKSKDQRTRHLLQELSTDEHEDIQIWAQTLAGLDGLHPQRKTVRRRRVQLMMGILGARGFLEWAVIAEDEDWFLP